jgi:hypothetical protein
VSSTAPELAFKPATDFVSTNSACYCPPYWPPPADWIISEDAIGNPMSQWGDPSWDFTGWAGQSCVLDFAGGQTQLSAAPIGPENQEVMRLLATLLVWGPKGIKKWSTLKSRFSLIRRLIVLCDDNGIFASDLSRFPKILSLVPDLYNPCEYSTVILLLDRFLRSAKFVGFAVVDEKALKDLSKTFADRAEDETEQTAYIPPRIWAYQNLQLRKCLDDFLAHQKAVEECYTFCYEAYLNNFGSFEALFTKGTRGTHTPFTESSKSSGKRTGRVFYGPFEVTAQRFGIDALIRRWIAPPRRGSLDIRCFSKYLSLVQHAGFAYTANFTLQRKDEVAENRLDCLIWDEDAAVGRIPIIRGETTKTEEDSDAWWPCSPNVEVAIKAMASVATLRINCAKDNPHVQCTPSDISNPLLLHASFEPWSSSQSWRPYSTRPKVIAYENVIRRFPTLFDPEQLTINESDLEIARKFTPNLNKKGKFQVGKIWPLGWHQLRRTGAINMFASGLLSESSIQVILKHVSVFQTRYYGRNFSRARFNEDLDELVVSARYEVMARQIEELVSDRYVSPLGEQRKNEIVVNLTSYKDFQSLKKASEKGEISFREIRLGGCTKRGHCQYGGYESIVPCAGGTKKKPCRDAMFDKEKRRSVEQQLKQTEQRAGEAKADSPRKSFLEEEANGLRNFLNATGI